MSEIYYGLDADVKYMKYEPGISVTVQLHLFLRPQHMIATYRSFIKPCMVGMYMYTNLNAFCKSLHQY